MIRLLARLSEYRHALHTRSICTFHSVRTFLPSSPHHRRPYVKREHAVVVGGSMAGLLAARVLSAHFDRVTLIERDRFPAEPVSRAGVPQARHAHVLWTRGREIVEALFPGLEDTLRAAGAVEVGVPADILWLTSAGWRQRFDVTGL